MVADHAFLLLSIELLLLPHVVSDLLPVSLLEAYFDVFALIELGPVSL